LAHMGIKERRAGFETGEPIRRAVEDARHGHAIVMSVIAEHTQVGLSEDLGGHLEMNAVFPYGDTRYLMAATFQAVKIETNLPVLVDDVGVGRGDVRRRGIFDRRFDTDHAGALLLHLRQAGQQLWRISGGVVRK
jgi:hypothetical protein